MIGSPPCEDRFVAWPTCHRPSDEAPVVVVTLPSLAIYDEIAAIRAEAA